MDEDRVSSSVEERCRWLTQADDLPTSLGKRRRRVKGKPLGHPKAHGCRHDSSEAHEMEGGSDGSDAELEISASQNDFERRRNRLGFKCRCCESNVIVGRSERDARLHSCLEG